MANNSYVNKVETADGSVLMDITDSDVQEGDVVQGKTFYKASGQRSVGTLGPFTGATANDDGTDGLVPAPDAGDNMYFLRGDGEWADGGRPMVILSYGHSTWAEFLEAYKNNVIVYCRASSNANPASGSQTRMAFMAYVNNAENPTEVEFQYYRSVSSHNATQQGDQVYIYKITNKGTWTVTVRESYTRMAAGTNLTTSYSNGVLTFNAGNVVANGGSDSASNVQSIRVGTDNGTTYLYVTTGDGTERAIPFST